MPNPPPGFQPINDTPAGFTPVQPPQGFRPLSDSTTKAPEFAPGKQAAGSLEAFFKMDPNDPEIRKQIIEKIRTSQGGLDDPAYQAMGLVSTGGLGAGLGKAIGGGIRKVGDYLMQKSVGAPRYLPGFGESLANQGLMGTKAAMTAQAAKGMEQAGQQIGELASNIPGTIEQGPVADKVASLAGKKITQAGTIPPEEAKDVGQILGKAKEIAQSEPVSGTEMADLRRISGNRARQLGAYKTVPSAQLKSQLASAEQAGRSEALKQAYAKAFPGATNPLADADESYSTLKQAQGFLTKPESMNTLSSFLKAPLPTSLVSSVGGRAAIGAGKAVQRAPNVIPTLQGLFSKREQ